MQKKFGDLVTFVRNGSAIPAFVVNSQLQANGKEFLSLLYADPVTGPSLVLAGATRKVGDVALSVAPMSPGAAFGWFDLPVADNHADVLEDHADARAAGELPPAIPPAVIGTPGIHIPLAQRQVLESDADKSARLANVEHQNPAPVLVSTEAVKEAVEEAKADGSGTLRYPDAENWTQTGDGTEYPGSYGVGPDLKVGDSVRVIESDGAVNPKLATISSITQESPDGVIYFVEGGDPKGYFRDRVVRVGPTVPTYPGTPPAAPIVPDRTSHDDVTAASLASKINASLGK